MEFIDRLRKLFKKEEKETEIEEISFSQISQWIKDQKKENEDEDNKILEVIKLNIQKFCKELNEKISALDKIDFDKIKSDNRVKNIVKENFKKYADHVEKLRQDLNEIETTNLTELFDDLDDLFLKFQKQSYMNFEKATVLIGKELGDIQYCINNFKSNVKKIINNNINYFDKTRILKIIEDNLIKKENLEKIKEEIEENISDYNNEIKIINNEIHLVEKRKWEMKESKDYIDYINKKEEIENLKEKLETEIYNLKKLIDFKQLTSFFHINQRDLEIVKAYKENFKNSFEKDENNQIIQLLNESKLINTNINNKFNEILELKKDIHNFVLEKDKTEILNENIKKKKIEIENVDIKKAKEGKRYDKLNKNIIEIIDLIKDDLKKINVVVD